MPAISDYAMMVHRRKDLGGDSAQMDIERFQGLIAVQQAISAARGDPQAVMAAIVEARAVMPQANGIVVEIREDDQVVYAAASGTSAPMLGLRLPLYASLSGMSILTGQPLRCDDSESDSRVNRAACRKVGLRSMIVVPIPHRGQTVGVLKYHAPEPDAFSEEDVLVAHLMVGPLAVGFASIGEEDARRAHIALQDVARLKEQFVATVNHELRTPLTSIVGGLELLAGSTAGDLPPAAATLIDIVTRNARRLRGLVDDLLDIDRMDAGKMTIAPRDVDLRDMLRDTVEQNMPLAARADIRLVLHLPRTPLLAHADQDRLAQAVTNLLSNAIKFSPNRSVVQVRLDRSADLARIRVLDQGPGVPHHLRHRLFDRFAQLDHTHGLTDLRGSGLGLAISRSIVEQMGGQLRLDERHRGGAAFEILLPLAVADAAESAA